ASASQRKCRHTFELPSACQMKIKSKKTRTAMVFEHRLLPNCASHIVRSRGDRFQFFHSLDYRGGIFQAVPCDCANYPTRRRNFLECVCRFMFIVAFKTPEN